jgi:nicotinamide-nucleotide amidase
MWFEKAGKVFVSMPGVPHEMKGMMTGYVLPRLPQYFSMPSIYSSTLLTAGIGESFLAEMIKSFEEKLPRHIKLAYLPNYGMVRLRLTGTGQSREIIEFEVKQLFKELKGLVHEHLVADEDDTMQVVVSKMLKQAGKTLATAESCTGGYIGHLLTAEPGASRFFKGGVISYANDVKRDLLTVPDTTLLASGAVSQQTVEQMAKGALALLKTDFAIAVSGIMGPDGGTPEKPVGLVWIAVCNSGHVVSHQFNFRFDRQRNIELTASNALNLLRKFMLLRS